MAPATSKATKRATASAVAASPKKKSRVDPAFAGIIATLQGAEDLSEKCREMLIGMTRPCLSVPKNERLSLQQAGVAMIEEKLQDHKKTLVETVQVAQKTVTDLEGSKNSLLQNLEEAKATLEEKKSVFLAAHATRVEATDAVKAAEVAVAEAKEAQKTGDARRDALEKEKGAIDAAYQEHFKAPMDANEGPHHDFLKPFIDNLGLEDSLASALPSSCVKPKEQRGGFDDLVLTELGKALEAKIATLEKSITEEADGVSGRQADIVSAEAALENKVAHEKTAIADFEAGSSAQQASQEAVRKASEEWDTFEPRMQAANEEYSLQNTKLTVFEEGTLKDFTNLRDKEAPVPAEEEAAPLGA